MPFRPCCSSLVVLLLFAGCEFLNLDKGSQDNDLEKLELRIHALIGDAEASTLRQCRTVGFGAKACGGPKTYLVYSITATDESELLPLVLRYNALDDERNRRLGLGSDCAFVTPPDTALVGGRCVAAGQDP